MVTKSGNGKVVPKQEFRSFNKNFNRKVTGVGLFLNITTRILVFNRNSNTDEKENLYRYNRKVSFKPSVKYKFGTRNYIIKTTFSDNIPLLKQK